MWVTYDVLKSKYTPDQALGGPQFAVIPGLVNAHSHGRGLTTFQLGSVDDALELKLIRDWGEAHHGPVPCDPLLLHAADFGGRDDRYVQPHPGTAGCYGR